MKPDKINTGIVPSAPIRKAGFFGVFVHELRLGLSVLASNLKDRKRWPLLFLELLIAVSLSVSYFYLTQKYAMGVNTDQTNFWVFSSFSKFNFHLDSLYDVWKGRFLGILFSGAFFDHIVGDNTVSIDQYGRIFALYQGMWLLLLFVVIILAFRNSLLINVCIFAGLTYNFSPQGGFYFYPWDIPSTLFFALAALLFDRRQIWQMIMVICVGCFYKETVLACALLLFFVEGWKWWRRLLTFAGILLLYGLGKKLFMASMHISGAVFSMNESKTLSDLLHTDKLIENTTFIFTPTLNHYAFVHAGTVLAVLVLGWQRRFLPYMAVILAHEIGVFWFADLHEFRNSMNCLPLCVFILAARWKDFSGVASHASAESDSKPSHSRRKPEIKPSAATPAWDFRETFPVVNLVWVLLIATSVAVPVWQYLSVIEYRRPDHQARVVKTLTASAERGDAKSQLQLAKHYLSGAGVAANQTNAFGWFLKAAKQGIAEAQCQVGAGYIQGAGTATDYTNGVAWFHRAAAQGNVNAQYNLGFVYENGLGVKQDLAEAAIWYQRAAEKGNVLAQNNLGLICFGMRKDYAEAAQWFRRAADQGNALSQNSLGVLYSKGLGVKQDANEALKWFQMAAQQGFAEAQNNCGLIFAGAQQMNEAVGWFRKAADQGHVEAQFNLAQCKEKGAGGHQDLPEAVLWYNRAAKQGYVLAQLALGRMYEAGQGVTADKIQAYKWFKLAQLRGQADAGKELTNCAAQMSMEQITTAEQEVEKSQNGGK